MAKNSFTIEIEGESQAISKLAKSSSEALKATQTAITKAALFIESEVVESIAGRRAEPKSVDTGRFQNSIRSESDDLSAQVFSPLDYAVYLEFGTSKITARSHFGNTANREESKVKEFIEDEIKSAL